MVLKIQAFQKYGIKTDKCVEEFEFCCWDSLSKWLEGYTQLNKCPKCSKEVKENKNGENEKVELSFRRFEVCRSL